MQSRKRSPENIGTCYSMLDRMTASEIAAMCGTTRNAIIGVWNRNKHLCSPISASEMSARLSRRQIEAHLERRLG